MKEFQLSCGAIVLLDDEDYERLPKTGWYLSKKEIHNPNTDYVVHDFYGKMRRWVLGLKQNDCSNLVVKDPAPGPISITRVFLTGFLFGNIAGILYSLSGAFLSLIAMAFAKKQNGLSVIGVSILGGVTHNIGQMIMAVLVTETIAVLYYVPVLLIAGMTTGIINGILAKTILKNKNIIIEGWK